MQELLGLIDVYGYLAVFVVSIFEGELATFLGGILANQDLLVIHYVIAAAILGAIVGDWSWFFLGRYKKEFVHRRFPQIMRKAEAPLQYITRRPRTMSFAMRFMYGFRAFMPLSIGFSHVPVRTFLFWNALGGFSWSVLMVSAGYFAGDFVQSFFGRFQGRDAKIVIVTVLVIVVLVFLYRMFGTASRKVLHAPPSDSIV